MDEQLKKQWIEALESGKYEFGTSYLKSTVIVYGTSNQPPLRVETTCHCTLGVLLDIIDPDGWFPPPENKADAVHYNIQNHEGPYITETYGWMHRLSLSACAVLPPFSVRNKYVEAPTHLAEVPHIEIQKEISERNDDTPERNYNEAIKYIREFV